MIKLKKTKELVEKEEVINIICNKCGNTCSNAMRYYNRKTPNCGFSGINEMQVDGGYDSKFIGDGASWKFSICEECLKKIVKTFIIPHEIKNENTSGKYVTLKKNDILLKKFEKKNRVFAINYILERSKELNNKVNKKELLKLSDKELSKLYYSLE